MSWNTDHMCEAFLPYAISYVSQIFNVGDGIPSDCRRVSIWENDSPISVAAIASYSKFRDIVLIMHPGVSTSI